jgi:hypothetical protein
MTKTKSNKTTHRPRSQKDQLIRLIERELTAFAKDLEKAFKQQLHGTGTPAHRTVYVKDLLAEAATKAKK